MLRDSRTARRSPRKTSRRLGVEILEHRLLLSADLDGLTALLVENGHPAGCCCPGCGGSPLPPALESSSLPSLPSDLLPTGPATPASPLTSVPLLNSLPGAAASLYLDFDGHFDASWGAYSNLTTPAYDHDSDPTTFSDSELNAIQQIWRHVAEDYAPFHVNVTTVLPASFTNGTALRVAVGGNGSWAGGGYGGLGYVNSFTNSIVNTAYVFSKNLSNGQARYVGDAITHEAGHSFGLQHQSEYSGNTKITEYYDGPGDGRAPLMGLSYGGTRSLWWNGPTTSASALQDDLSVLARSANGFGYRADDHGNNAGTASLLSSSGGQVNASGVITTTADVDYFAFSTGAGQVSLTAAVSQNYNNLDVRLELRDANGTVLAAADPGNSFSATVVATVEAGTYYLAVASHGSYGDVGQFTISGNMVGTGTTGAAPTELTAAIVSVDRVSLTWKDNGSDETSFSVERSLDGVNWVQIGTTAANVASYQDTGLSPGTTCYYRVRAFYAGGSSAPSDVVGATTLLTPATISPPSNLTAVAVSGGRVNLRWQDNSNNETGFAILRSVDGGATWALIKVTRPNATSFADRSVRRGRQYAYRVYAFNRIDASPLSNTVTVATPSSARRVRRAQAFQAPSADASPTSSARIDQFFALLGRRSRQARRE